MPRKKNIDKATNNNEQKAVRKRVKKEKVPLRIPTVIKYKIPSKILDKIPATVNSKLTAKERKQISTTAAKIEMANKVALAQLAKPMVMIPEEFSPKTVETEKPKRSRKKKCDINPTNIAKSKTGVTNVVPKVKASAVNKKEKPATIKKVVKVVKPRASTESNKQKKQVDTTKVTNKRKADSTSKEPITRKRRKNVEHEAAESENDGSVTLPVPRKRILKIKGKIQNTGDVTKSELSDQIGSPSILERVTIKTEDTTNEKEKSNEPLILQTPIPAESRKTSTSSISTQSWIKDISISSSNSPTRFTVNSPNEMFFEMKKKILKIPVVKLGNIDSQLNNATSSIKIKEGKICEINTNLNTAMDTDCDNKSGNASFEKVNAICCNDGGVSDKGDIIGDEGSDSDSDSSSSSSSSSGSSSSSISDGKSLNLSTSSISPAKSNTNDHRCSYTKEDPTKIEHALDKLSSILKKIDLEIIHWVGNKDASPNVKVKSIQNKVLSVLKEENEIHNLCRKLKSTLNEGRNNDNLDHSPEKSVSDRIPSESNVVNDFNLVNGPENIEENNELPPAPSLGKRYNSVVDYSDGSDYSDRGFDQYYGNYNQDCNDDDDTLSLFAESLTGIDSSRINSSAASASMSLEFEEYVPQPISKTQIQINKVKYSPTKINQESVDGTEPKMKAKTVCEKQKADSTNRDNDQEKGQVLKASAPANVLIEKPCVNVTMLPPPDLGKKKKEVRLMSSTHKAIPSVKTIVFRGVCFFNLISNCKKTSCKFPHAVVPKDEVMQRLARLSDEAFISEYMMMRTWPDLRNNYGMCFFMECEKRGLTRILIEMVIDFCTKSCEMDLKIHLTEFVLMHLSKVDLEICEDLLLHSTGGQNRLCDFFMKVLGVTQNFSRFKLVFCKLTNLIVGENRTFDLDVANNILERVCILPFEKSVASAMVDIIRNTSPEILQNSMLGKFEKLLYSSDVDLREKLLDYKEQAAQMQLEVGRDAPNDAGGDIDQAERERYTSPDTTKLDTMKHVEEPVVIRTMNQGVHKQIFSPQSLTPSTSRSSDGDEYRPRKKPKFKHWRPPNFIVPTQSPYNRPLLRTPPVQRMLTQRHICFGPPPKFPRRSGPPY